MSNSYVLTLFHKFYSRLKTFYDESYLKKIEIKLGEALKLTIKNSIVVKLISTDRENKDIKAYRLYIKSVKIIESIFDFFRCMFKRYKATSCTVNSINDLFNDKKNTIETISIFSIAFSTSLLVLKALKGDISMKLILILLVAIIIALINLLESENIKNAFANSFFIRFVKGIFTIEDEGEILWK